MRVDSTVKAINLKEFSSSRWFEELFQLSIFTRILGCISIIVFYSGISTMSQQQLYYCTVFTKSSWNQEMKQLDVDVSPPAFVWNPHLTLAKVTFDLDPCDLWPWPSRPLTSRSLVKYTMQNPWKSHFWDRDLERWPMTLTFIHDLDTITVDHHTKFGDPISNGSWDMNFCPVTFCLVWILVKLQTDRQKAMHMSPPCICTGVLKKVARNSRGVQ